MNNENITSSIGYDGVERLRADMELKTNKAKDIIDNFETIMNRLNSDETWSGQGAQQFYDDYKNCAKNFYDFIAILKTYSSELKRQINLAHVAENQAKNI